MDIKLHKAPLTKNQRNLLHDFNGTFLETLSFTVSSNGTTITGSLEKSGTGDLTMVFSDGFSIFDCTPAATVTLTAGSDTSPQKNYVYILQSDKTQMAVSTSDWPTTEHIKIAEVVLQSAATVQTTSTLALRQWNDHVTGTNDQGHKSHIGERLRWEQSAWKSGATTTWTITTNAGAIDNIDVATTAASVYQMHLHTTGAKDTSTGDEVLVVNDNTTPYLATSDLEDLLTDSAGVSMSGRYYNLVLWGSVSSDASEEHLFINLPGGSYNKQSDAIADVSGYTNFDIPTDFRGYAFLISRITLRHQAAANGTFTSIQETDLRGTVPNIVAGGGTAAITTEFADNQFKLFDETDPTKEIAFQASGITTGNTRIITMADANVDLTDISTNTTAIALNTTHRTSDGSDHSFIDQDVTSGSSPTFDGTNFTGIDISAGTNLAATSPIVLTDNNLSLDQSSVDHGSLSGLTDDDHSQYALLAGRSGGQTLIGGTGASDVLTLQSTSHATKGSISFNDEDITNVGDIALVSISSDSGTSINVVLGATAGDDFTVDTNKLVVEGDTGNVGIGTTGPNASLDIASPGNGNYGLQLQGNTNNLIFYHDSGDEFYIYNDQQNNGLKIYDGTGGIDIVYNDSSVMEFDSGGGANLLSGDLQINGTSVITFGRVGQNFTQMNVDNLRLDGNTLSATTGTITLTPAGGSNLNINLSSTGDFAVNTNDLYVDTSAGYVGIGTTNPSEQLELTGTGIATGLFVDRILFSETWPTNNSLTGDLGTWTSTLSEAASTFPGTPPSGGYFAWTNGVSGYLTSPGFSLEDYTQIDGSAPGVTETYTQTRVFIKGYIQTDSMDNSGEWLALEVYNGSSWTEVYRHQSNENSGSNAGWQKITADITPYINSSGNTQIRFYVPFNPGTADYFAIGSLFIYESDIPSRLGDMYMAPSYTEFVNNNLYITSGNVGIGTTGPAVKLDIKSSGSSTNQFQVTRSTNTNPISVIRESSANAGIFRLYDGSGNIDVELHSSGPSYLRGGNVGINTASPSFTLDINGSLSKSSGSFFIDHPLDPTNNTLCYGFVESPRYDLSHRGTVKLTKGKATVNIDTYYGMTPGTFEALTQDVQVISVQAIDSFVRVKAMKVVGAEFTIEAEDPTFAGEVNWLVIAERADAWIKYTDETDADGHLINEQLKADPEGTELDDEIKEVKTKAEEGIEIVEVDMSNKRGYYRIPEAFGQAKPTKRIIKQLKTKTS